MRSSGPAVRPLAARALPDRRVFYSATVSFGVDIVFLSVNHGKHPADEFELDCVHDASVRFALIAFPLIICPELRIIVDSAPGRFGKSALDFIVAGFAHMITPSDGRT